MQRGGCRTESFAGPDQLADARIDLGLPAASAEHSVMTDPGLQVMPLSRRVKPGAQLLRGKGLPDRANVVVLALYGHQRGAPDRPGLDRAAARHQHPARQLLLLKDLA